jgi:hypothetical protein
MFNDCSIYKNSKLNNSIGENRSGANYVINGLEEISLIVEKIFVIGIGWNCGATK